MALLRAVNLGNRNELPMADMRRLGTTRSPKAVTALARMAVD